MTDGCALALYVANIDLLLAADKIDQLLPGGKKIVMNEALDLVGMYSSRQTLTNAVHEIIPSVMIELKGPIQWSTLKNQGGWTLLLTHPYGLIVSQVNIIKRAKKNTLIQIGSAEIRSVTTHWLDSILDEPATLDLIIMAAEVQP